MILCLTTRLARPSPLSLRLKSSDACLNSPMILQLKPRLNTMGEHHLGAMSEVDEVKLAAYGCVPFYGLGLSRPGPMHFRIPFLSV